MASINRHEGSYQDPPEQKGYAVDVSHEQHAYQEDQNHQLHRGLKSRQITMIAIGGAIGTGLIIGT